MRVSLQGCNCYVYINRNKFGEITERGSKIVFCPMHDAAPMLHEVAKDALYLHHLVMEQRVTRDTEINAITTLAHKAKTVLALVEKDSQ